MNELEKRNEVILYGQKLLATGLVQGTWGNLSLRLDQDRFLITPSGMNYETLQPEDICIVRISNGEFEGRRKPSSERELHRLIMQNYPEVKAVIHTHSLYCQVFAAAGKSLPAIDSEFIKSFPLGLECTKHELAGTLALAQEAVKTIGTNKGCLLANHGVVLLGNSLSEALALALNAESGACDFLDRD